MDQLTVTLLELPVDKDVFNIAYVCLQEDGHDRINPAYHSLALAIPHNEIGLRTESNYA
ncbi:Fc.00g080080.m01.CDS01 [Cosmosporella sp. VM-42]